MDTWKQRPGMRGPRFTFPPSQPGAWLTDGTVDWLETTCFMPTSSNCAQLGDTINGVSVSKSFQRFSF